MILFKPDSTYWVLVATQAFYYFDEGKLEVIDYKNIVNDIFYERQLKEMEFGNKLVKYDNLFLEIENKIGKTEVLRFPIEVASIYGFMDSVPELVKNIRGYVGNTQK